jgi:WD40 repeat protein
MNSAKRTRKLKFPTVFEFALSPRGDRIAALGRNVVTADTISMKRFTSCHPFPHPSDACFNHDGSKLAVKNTSGRIVILDPVTGETIVDFNNKRDGEGANVHFSPCGNFLVDASWGGKIFVRNVKTAQKENEFSFGGEMIKDVLCSRDGKLWAFTHQPKVKASENELDNPYLTIWNWPLSECEIVPLPLCSIDGTAMSPDGNNFALTGFSGKGKEKLLSLMSRTGEIFRSIDVGHCKKIRWSPDGKLIGAILDSRIAVYTFPDLIEIRSYDLKYPSDVSFSPDNSFIALGSWDGGSIEQLGDVAENCSVHWVNFRK